MTVLRRNATSSVIPNLVSGRGITQAVRLPSQTESPLKRAMNEVEADRQTMLYSQGVIVQGNRSVMDTDGRSEGFKGGKGD